MKSIIKSFEGKELQVVNQKGEPWFVAKDVYDILEIQNTSQAINDVCKGPGICSTYIKSVGQKRKALCINEPNLYRLIFKSRKPFAEAFQDWVFEEVIPEIRKAGLYDKTKDIQKSDATHLRVWNESKPVRMKFTEQLKEQGCCKSSHYINITRKMKTPFGITSKKDSMNTVELLEIMASESVATAMMLQEKPQGYYECLPICIKSSEEIKRILPSKRMSYES